MIYSLEASKMHLRSHHFLWELYSILEFPLLWGQKNQTDSILCSHPKVQLHAPERQLHPESAHLKVKHTVSYVSSWKKRKNMQVLKNNRWELHQMEMKGEKINTLRKHNEVRHYKIRVILLMEWYNYQQSTIDSIH